MNEPVRSVRWSDHAVARLKERLNAVPPDVTDLLLGRVPFAMHGLLGYAVDVQHVARFVLARDPNPNRAGCWVVVTVLEWGAHSGRQSPKRAQTGRADLDRKRFDLTDEDLQWTERL